MPKKRRSENKPYPRGWRWKNGALRYRVPLGLEHQWYGKKEFTLGRTEAMAYRTWSERLQLYADVRSVGEALERYLVEVVPEKAYATQESNRLSIRRLTKVFGHFPINSMKPKFVYQSRDKANKKHGPSSVNRDLEVISHLYSKCVEWGLVDYNPIKGQVKKNSIKRRERYIEDWELTEAFKVASPMLQSYIRLKLLTGLRRGDLLRLTESDLLDDGIYVQPSKTSKSSGVRLIIEWTDELHQAVEDALAVRKKSTVPWLFCTNLGYSYLNEKGKADGFDSLWRRFMEKAIAQTELQERFQEKDLRKKTASDMDLEAAKRILGHTSASTTKRHYRIRGERVRPHTLKKKE